MRIQLSPTSFLVILTFLTACRKTSVPVEVEVYPINLATKGAISNDSKSVVVIEVGTPENRQRYSGKIERRGGYSIKFEKHSYELDLMEDVPLANLPADDDWILNANYIDKTFMRHVFAYDLFRDMHVDNRAARTKYVELHLNNDYQGLYVLMEKLDKSTFGVKASDEMAVIFKEPPLFRTGDFTPQDSTNYWQQTSPKKRKDDRTSYIAGVQNFLRHSSDADFHRGVGSIFDLRNIMDWHLLLLLTNNNDGILKNFYLYRVDSATPLRVAPWDYDHSLGRDGDNELNLTRTLKLERSILFQRLLTSETYQKALRSRWEKLNQEGILAVDGLLKRIDKYRKNLQPLVDRNFAKWPINSPHYYDDNGFITEVQLMSDYLRQRHQWIENYLK